MERTGNISIASENMMPIIKKWLYSEKDIFLREIVANAADAITKRKKLAELGECAGEEGRITVTTDETAHTLTVEDNGIGMTEEEVEKYITRIAFSGAADFLEKYEKSGDGIIGHFGLGFYSAYMVSQRIEIFTKSCLAGAKGVHWESDGESTYTIGDCEKESVGTRIVMHLAEGEEEFSKEHAVRTLLGKYCSFMPYEIYLNPKDKGEDKPVNNTSPLYLKAPKDCTEEEYAAFYRDTFFDFNEPLFQIHLNMDYPFRLKGILYFPKVRDKLNLERGQVKLYCNRVFVADNIKEVIPEFLMLLNGVIDCPDIPLNVSRSFLQNDSGVRKIAKHIVKKVADRLTELFRNDRARFEKCWPDLQTFVKFGCIKDEDFYGKVKDLIIFKNLAGEYVPVESTYCEEEKDAEGNTKEPLPVYYVSDPDKQAQYIAMFRGAGKDALLADSFIDPHFLSYLEYKNPARVRFLRIDADVDAIREEGEKDEELEKLFSDLLGEKGVTVRTEKLRDGSVPAVINVSEYLRRTQEMGKYYGYGAEEEKESLTLIVNTANGAVQALKTAGEEEKKEGAKFLFLLALMNYRTLKPEELAEFTASAARFAENFLKTK